MGWNYSLVYLSMIVIMVMAMFAESESNDKRRSDSACLGIMQKIGDAVSIPRWLMDEY
jgi:hypothetical protein